MEYRYQLLVREHCHRGFLKLDRLSLRHEHYAGGWGPELNREVVLRPPSVAVLPYDPDRDCCVLIEQFRVGALEIVQPPWLLEIVAGTVEPGENAEAVVSRELFEETGGELLALQPICQFFSSPGGSNEYVSLYCARVDSSAMGGIHGLEDEGEDIRVFRVSRQEAMVLLGEARIVTAQALVALQWLALNHANLRQIWA
jgi:ADP-ribose pyrophosphatase